MLLTVEHAAAQAVEPSTDPADLAMRTVFDRCGWASAGSVTSVLRRRIAIKCIHAGLSRRPGLGRSTSLRTW